VTADVTPFCVLIHLNSVPVIRNEFFPYNFRGILAVNYFKNTKSVNIWHYFTILAVLNEITQLKSLLNFCSALYGFVWFLAGLSDTCLERFKETSVSVAGFRN